jgi:hypothetical protein
MNIHLTRIAGAAAIAVLSGTAVSAAVIDAIGDQDFADGAIMGFAAFEAANAGDPAPFNDFVGADGGAGASFGSVAYTHSFTLSPGVVTGASITLGLYDLDTRNPFTSAPVDTFDIFFDGISQDISVWLGAETVNRTYSARTMTVDPALLLDGSLNVSIVMTSGNTLNTGHTGNGFGIDFSSLSADVAPVPLPAGGLLLVAGIGAAAMLRRWRRA